MFSIKPKPFPILALLLQGLLALLAAELCTHEVHGGWEVVRASGSHDCRSRIEEFREGGCPREREVEGEIFGGEDEAREVR